MTRIIGAVFARGGSKGVPRKNIRMCAGKPLIAYSIEMAKALDVFDRIIVSTDDEEIAEVARSYGAEVPFMRPDYLARDESREIDSWKHMVTFLGDQNKTPDILVSIPATSPLRGEQDVKGCIELLLHNDIDVALTVTRTPHNPYFSMVKKSNGRLLEKFISHEDRICRRQDAPLVYVITGGAYAVRVSYLLQTNDLFAGRVQGIAVPQGRALDIDSEYDLHIAELLLEYRKGKMNQSSILPSKTQKFL